MSRRTTAHTWCIALGLSLFAAGCPAPLVVGSPCRQTTDCKALENGYCARVEICTRLCDVTPCPAGSACVVEGPRRVCLPTCSTSEECSTGFACVAKADEDSAVCEKTNPLGVPAQ